MATRMQQRRGTSTEWTTADPILGTGEIGYETDTNKFKIGDGVNTWSALVYFTSIDDLVDGAPALLDTLNEIAAAIGDDADFITTINASVDAKVAKSGDTLTGDLTLAQDPTANLHAATKQYVDTIGTDVYNTAVANTTDQLSALTHVFVGASAPLVDVNNSGALQSGDSWLDRSSGSLFIYTAIDNGNDFVWVEAGNNDDLDSAVAGADSLSFPTSPSNGDTLSGYVYDASRTAWVIDQARAIDFLSDVTISAIAADDSLMYNDVSGEWENVPGIRLDGSNFIPLAFLTNALTELRGDASSQTLGALEDSVESNTANITSAQAELDALSAGVSADFDTLLKIETYVKDHSKVQTEVDWAADASIPDEGSINVSTGSEIRIKIGDGINTWSNLTFIPSNAYVASEIGTAIAPLATKASPTFTGTVSLPADTSIGNVDATEIAHLDGVTSGVQSQLDDLDTLKAPLADPTFTGTVSGVTKTMVGLGNVDNTTDAAKPVSTAAQAALDLKADIASPSFSGTAEAADLVVTGNLTVQGNTTTISASDLSIRDNMIYLNQAGSFTLSGAVGDGTNVVFTTTENHDIKLGDYVTVTGVTPAAFDVNGDGVEVTSVTSNTITILSSVTDTYVSGGIIRGKSHFNPDLGWAAGRYDVVNGTGYAHAGLFRDATDGTFKFFDGYTPEPDESVFIDTTHASFALAPIAPAKVVFPDGTEQTKAGVPSISTFTEKTASYTLDTLDHQDGIVEMNSATAATFTIPTDAALAWPVGASIDVFASGTGTITIAGDTGVTVNATPGLVLRTQWSSATLLKRGADSWVVYGDLKA